MTENGQFERMLADAEAEIERLKAERDEAKRQWNAADMGRYKAEAERESLQRANLEIGTQMLRLQAERDLWKGLHKQALLEAETLEAERDRLEQALITIAGFAVGHGDVCEVIAKKAREALAVREKNDDDRVS